MRTTQRPQGVHAGQRRLRPRGRRSRPDDSTDLTLCDTSQPSEGDPMAVTHVVNGLVFDGTGADLRDGLVVTFEDSRIVEVGVQRPSRDDVRSEEHTSELKSLIRTSYALFCLHKKKENQTIRNT